MSTIRIRSCGPLFCLVIISGLVGYGAATIPSLLAAEAKDAKLNELLKEKVVILRRVAQMCEAGFRSGEITYRDLFQAERDLLRAELDICQSDDERIAILNKLIARTEKRNEIYREPMSQLEMSTKYIQQSEVELLDLKIELERIKAK